MSKHIAGKIMITNKGFRRRRKRSPKVRKLVWRPVKKCVMDNPCNEYDELWNDIIRFREEDKNSI